MKRKAGRQESIKKLDHNNAQMNYLRVEKANNNLLKPSGSSRALNSSMRNSFAIKKKLYPGERLQLDNFFEKPEVLTR